jgi:cyclophilin family peptidyl-prolyl cis-trans isomerase
VIQGFMAQGGDIEHGDGTGGKSIFGDRFADENLALRHHKRGMLSMANSGEHSNASQFFVTFDRTDWLDGYHVVFGELISGGGVLDVIEKSGSRDGDVEDEITILSSGDVV